MVRLHFRKKSQETADSTTHDDINSLDRDGVQARLQEIRGEIDYLNGELDKLFEAKQTGRMHDGQYNLVTTSVTMELQRLEKQEQTLLVLMDKINSDFARTAINSQ